MAYSLHNIYYRKLGNRGAYEETLARVDAKLNLIAERARAHANDARGYELAQTGREIRQALQEFIVDSRRRHAETTAKFNGLLQLERQLRESRGQSCD
jgi:hypothetical protein